MKMEKKLAQYKQDVTVTELKWNKVKQQNVTKRESDLHHISWHSSRDFKL